MAQKEYASHSTRVARSSEEAEHPGEADERRESDDLTALRAIIESEIDDAETFIDYDISDKREAATKYYKGAPFGDEEEGRSQVVSRDVHDTVNSILPSLMRIFFGPEKVVEFIPQGPEDVARAEQATDYINFIVQRDNPGFSVFWDAFKDALVRKVGIIKYWWDQSVEITTNEYTGIDEIALLQILEDLRQSIEAEITDYNVDPQTGLYSATITMKRYSDRACIMAVPPEEFLIDRNARTVDDARFVAHRCIKTVSELVAMGYDRDEVKDSASDSFEDLSFNQERIARQPSDFTTPLDSAQDPMQHFVLYHECYVRADLNDDGISELRKVCTVGSDHKILHNEQIDERPFATFCPDPEPHTFFGECPAEKTMDIQKIKSGVLRATLDGLTTTLHPRTVVKTSGVNISDVLNTENGAIIRADSVDNVRTLNIPFVGDKSFPMLEYMDRVREERTGMTRQARGLDAESLVNMTATASAQQFTQSQQHIELIARIFAETGMKRLFRGLLKLAAKNQRKARVVSLRNHWVAVDPRNWKTDMDVTANVALGGSTDREKMAFLSLIAQKQESIMMQAGVDNPLAGPEQYHQTLSAMTELAGFKNVSAFWKDPSALRLQPPVQKPPTPNLEVLKAQARAQASLQKAQMDNQTRIAVEKIRGDAALQRELLKVAADGRMTEAQRQAKMAEINARYRTSINVAEINALVAAAKMENDRAIQASEHASVHLMHDGHA